jgi:hypothetical protein
MICGTDGYPLSVSFFLEVFFASGVGVDGPGPAANAGAESPSRLATWRHDFDLQRPVLGASDG